MAGNGESNNTPTNEEVQKFLEEANFPTGIKAVLLQALKDRQELHLLKLKERVEAGKDWVDHLVMQRMKNELSNNLLKANPDLVKDEKLIVSEDNKEKYTLLVFKKEDCQLKVSLFSHNDGNNAGRIYSAVAMVEPNDIDLTKQYKLLEDFFTLYKKAYPNLELDKLTGFSEPKQ